MNDVNENVVDAVTDNVIAEIEKKAKVKGKSGRKAMLSDEKAIVRVLTYIFVKDAENIPSRPILLQLVDRGLLTTQDVKSGTRGRPAKEYILTNAGLEMIGEPIEEESAEEETASAEEAEPDTEMDETATENRELVTE